jgi:drug/metabolite transporter (DMT)-like permease
MLLSSVMLSFFTLFAKFASEELPFFLLLFLRFGVPLLLVLPWLIWTAGTRELFATDNFGLQLLRAGCILLYQYSIFYYLLNSSLLNATVLQNTAPLFMPILERVFFGIRFHLRVLLSIVISFVGVLCILQPDTGLLATLGIAGILAPLGQAGSQVLYSHQARNENQRSNLLYFFLLCTVVTGVVWLLVPEVPLDGLERHSSPLMIGIGLLLLGITSIFNQSLRGLAYRHGRASALAPFLYVSLLISGILDWALFHQLPNWLSLAGAILVIAGGMIQLYKQK